MTVQAQFASAVPARRWKSVIDSYGQELVILGALIVLFIGVGFYNHRFLSSNNITSIFVGYSYIAIAAIGMSMVIISGNIDVSVCQNPYEIGFQSVKLLKALIGDDTATVEAMFPNGATTLDTGVRVIVPKADSPVKVGDVITVKDMKEWLISKGLKSSCSIARTSLQPAATAFLNASMALSSNCCSVGSFLF